MWLELVAAALVGIALLWLVFEPVFAPPPAPTGSLLGLDELEDPEPTRSGLALGALKEIEFDRETGKLSDGDYDFLRQKYTAEALAALRAEEPAAAAPAAACGHCGAPAVADARFCAECGRPTSAPARCPTCGDPLPAGSRFCGGCGGRVAA